MKTTQQTISVIIKTYDDRRVRSAKATLAPLRDVLLETLQILREQSVLPTEVVVVDSSAGSGIRDVIEEFKANAVSPLPYALILVPLAPAEFTYSHALNIGIAASSGDLLVSLSGDATPANREWIEQLITPLQEHEVAGVYSRHIPRPGMRLSLAERVRLWWRYRSRKTHIRTHDHIFSNASSCFPASLVQEYPFDESLEELEDYAWAKEMQEAGFRIAYAGRSEVYHSHATKTWPTLKRMLYYAWLRFRTDAK